MAATGCYNCRMQIVVFGPDHRVGALHNGQVVDLNLAHARLRRERPGAASAADLPTSLELFILTGPPALDGARTALDFLSAAGAGPETHDPSTVQLHAPWVPRARIACGGGNFAKHLAGARTARSGTLVTAEDAYREARSAPPWGF